MRNIVKWNNFLSEAAGINDPDKKYINSHIWWGALQGDDDTGGGSFCLYPISGSEPNPGTPAEISLDFFHDENGDCDEFEDGTAEHDECMELAEEKWEKGCQSKAYDRIYFFMTISQIAAKPHPGGGIAYNEWYPPLPPTVTQFIEETESRTKHYIILAATKTKRMKSFIEENFFKHNLYKNEDAVHIIRHIDELIAGEDVGINILVDQLKELADKGEMLDYGFIIDLFKKVIPQIETKMIARGIEMERLYKLDKANKLLRRK